MRPFHGLSLVILTTVLPYRMPVRSWRVPGLQTTARPEKDTGGDQQEEGRDKVRVLALEMRAPTCGKNKRTIGRPKITELIHWWMN